MKKYLIILLLFFEGFGLAFSQTDSTEVTKEKNVDKLFDLGDQVVDLISGEKWAFIPAVVYSPETSLGLGVRAIRVFRFKGEGKEVLRPSTLPITLLHTFNNQTVFTTELDLWASENRDYFNGRLELSNFPFRYFGIGNEIPTDEGESYSTRYAYIHLNYERKIIRGLYIGPRYEFRIDDIYDRVPNGILEGGQPLGFDGQRISGLGFGIRLDNRDNIFQPSKGWFNRIGWMSFQSFLGSEFTFNQYTIDLRKYLKTFEHQSFALQSWWSFTTGNAPFQHLSLTGGSDRMRGYFEGKFRDRHAMVQQVEYRFPVYRNLGLVVFGHGGQVATELGDFRLKRMKYGAGVGFRYRLNEEGLNIRLDIAFGDQRAFYFGLNEVI